jgi:hypothetical protein
MKLSRTHKQRLARELRNRHGIERTPEQAEGLLSSAVRNVRRQMIAKGHGEFRDMTDTQVYAAMMEALSG